MSVVDSLISVDEFKNRVNSGESFKSIAIQLGVSRILVSNFAIANNISSKCMKKVSLNVNDVMSVDEFRKFVEDGESFTDIGKRFNINRRKVTLFAKKHNISSKCGNDSKRKQLPYDEIKDEYLSGISLYALADKYNISITNLKNNLLFKFPNFEFRDGNEVRPDDLNNIDKLIDFTNQKLTQTDISKLYGVKVQTVINAYKRLGIKPYKVCFPISIDELKTLYFDRNLSPAEIGKLFGVPVTSVYTVLRRNNIKLK